MKIINPNRLDRLRYVNIIASVRELEAKQRTLLRQTIRILVGTPLG